MKMPREATERSRSRIAVPPCFFGSPIRGPSLPYGNGILDRQEPYDNLQSCCLLYISNCFSY